MSARACQGCGTTDRCHRGACQGIASKNRGARWCCSSCARAASRSRYRESPEGQAEQRLQEARNAGYAPIPPDELSAILKRKREGCKCADGGIPNGEGNCFKCGFRIITEPKRSKHPARTTDQTQLPLIAVPPSRTGGRA